jgi:hypothetical protein
MMTRYRRALAWFCVGHVVLAGLYWLLLQIPESNIWMLAASAVTALAAVWVSGVVELTGVRILAATEPLPAAARIACVRAGLVVLPLAVFAVMWWLSGAAADRHARHSGQLDAWMIANTGWTRTAWLHEGLSWLIAFVRYGVGVSLAATLLSALASAGISGVASRWILKALRWKPLLATTLALLAGIWLPWHVAYWRPDALPPTWVQPAFAGLKLALLFVVGNLAWAIVLRTAARQT